VGNYTAQSQTAWTFKSDIVDLKPGTPYSVRLSAENGTNKMERENGPETVFDTKPVDCGPKGKKKCVVM
jgi:hypothetical protein